MDGFRLDRKPHRGAVAAAALPWLASLLLAGPGLFEHAHAGGDALHRHHGTQEHHHWWWPWSHHHDHPHDGAAEERSAPFVVASVPQAPPEALRTDPEFRDWHAADVQHLHRTEPHAPGVLPPLVLLIENAPSLDRYARVARASRLRLTGLPAVRGPPTSTPS